MEKDQKGDWGLLRGKLTDYEINARDSHGKHSYGRDFSALRFSKRRVTAIMRCEFDCIYQLFIVFFLSISLWHYP